MCFFCFKGLKFIFSFHVTYCKPDYSARKLVVNFQFWSIFEEAKRKSLIYLDLQELIKTEYQRKWPV